MIRFLSLVVAVFLFGCSSVNPQLKQQVDDHLARYEGASGVTIDTPSDVKIADWAAGQYLITASIHDGQQSLSKMAIESVGEEGIWVKIQTLGYKDKSEQRLLFAHQPRRPEDMKDAIKKMVIVQNNEQPVEYDFEDESNPIMAFMKDSMESAWAGLVVTTEDEGAAEVVVPAGTFRGCRAYVTTTQVFGRKVTYRGCMHSAVPVNGMVAGSSEDGKTASELLEFGFDGGPELL